MCCSSNNESSLLASDWLARQIVAAHGFEAVYAPLDVCCLYQNVLGFETNFRRRLLLADHVSPCTVLHTHDCQADVLSPTFTCRALG